jgi:citrate lyase beta subunit
MSARQRPPVSVLYGGANRFSRETPAKLQRLAQRALDTWVSTPDDLTRRLGLEGDEALLATVHERLAHKLAAEPLEDLRIDFEDGLGELSDDEVRQLARHCGAELAVVDAAHQPPHAGLRVGQIDDEHRALALEVTEAFLSAYTGAGGEQPVIITLPKVERADDVRRFVRGLEHLEAAIEPKVKCPVEVMVESSRGLMRKGRVIVHKLVSAGGGRVASVHLGSYDYAASLGIMGAHQQPEHPSVELARQLLLLATHDLPRVRVSDGALHQLPLPIHRGDELSEAQRAANTAAMTDGWQRHAALVLHALRMGIRQGWDLHPHQLISRYAATFLFYREGLDRLIERCAAFRGNEGRGIRTAADWDDNASYRGLLLHLILGHLCGAITDEEMAAAGFELRPDVD